MNYDATKQQNIPSILSSVDGKFRLRNNLSVRGLVANILNLSVKGLVANILPIGEPIRIKNRRQKNHRRNIHCRNIAHSQLQALI